MFYCRQSPVLILLANMRSRQADKKSERRKDTRCLLTLFFSRTFYILRQGIIRTLRLATLYLEGLLPQLQWCVAWSTSSGLLPSVLMSLPWGMSLSLKAESGLILSVGPPMPITGSGTQHITVSEGLYPGERRTHSEKLMENAEHTQWETQENPDLYFWQIRRWLYVLWNDSIIDFSIVSF